MNDLLDAVEKVLDWWEFSGSQIEGKQLMDDLSIEFEKIKNESKNSRFYSNY